MAGGFTIRPKPLLLRESNTRVASGLFLSFFLLLGNGSWLCNDQGSVARAQRLLPSSFMSEIRALYMEILSTRNAAFQAKVLQTCRKNKMCGGVSQASSRSNEFTSFRCMKQRSAATSYHAATSYFIPLLWRVPLKNFTKRALLRILVV